MKTYRVLSYVPRYEAVSCA